MSSSLGVVLGVVVLVLAGVVVVLVRELVLRAPAPRLPSHPPHHGIVHGTGTAAPMRYPPRINRYGELEDS